MSTKPALVPVANDRMSTILDIQDFTEMQLSRLAALMRLISQNGEETEHGFQASDEDIVTLTYWCAETADATIEKLKQMHDEVRGRGRHGGNL